MPTHLIIIGGGVIGTFFAYHALEHGLTVKLFERDSRPKGATTQNFGQVVPSGMDERWQLYGRRSLEIYKQLQQQVEISLRPHGSVYLASDAEEWQLLQELYEINQSQAYPSQLLTATQCLDRYPGLRADYCVGGLFFPEEVTVEAISMIHRVLAYLSEQKGLDYHPNTLIQSVERTASGCKVVDNRGRTYQADKVMICSGDEFKVLFPEVFDQSDLELTQLHMMRTVPQPKLRFKGNVLTGLTVRRYESFRACPSYDTVKAQEDPDAFWKKWGIHLLFKQSPDGSVVIGDSHEYADVAQADTLRNELHPEVRRYLLEAAKDIFELEDWTLQREWNGRYTQCKTQDVFTHTLEEDIHIVTGIGGKGMTASPGFTQAYLAEIVF